ncbi:MAG: SseB family protein [Rhodobacteraceae bacterium]|nr:MAG: SseB family protein [Paracoccaceae bacterium]
MAQSLIDQAWQASEDAPEDDSLRLAYFARLVEAELFLLLEREAVGEQIAPRVFDLEDGPIVLAFDSEERLTEFTGLPAPYAALPGRALAEMLTGTGMGLGLNLGVAPSSRLLPPEVLDWLAEMAAQRPEELDARIARLSPPRGLPEAVLLALDQRLARMEGLAAMAYLVATESEAGARGHMLAFVDPAEGAESALARAVQSALSFSGLEAGALDVTFLVSSEARAAEFARVGLRFDLPQPAEPALRQPPGSDPDTPPRLR